MMRHSGWLVLVALLTSAPAHAGVVKEINAKKKMVDVEIEEVEIFAKGDKVCFAKEGGADVGCGAVTKAKDTLIQVKVETKKDLDAIEVGMIARKSAGEGSDAGFGSSEAAGSDKPAKGEKVVIKTKPLKKKKKNPFRVVGFYGAAPMTPSTYQKLAYKAPTSATPATLWSQDEEIKSTYFGLNVEAAIPLGTRFAIVPGLRYRSFTPSQIEADYQPKRNNPYVTVEQQASAFGLSTDFQYLRLPVGPLLNFNFLAGLDLDFSTVSITALKKDDTGVADVKLTEASSKLAVLSLRLGANGEINFVKLVGARAGLTIGIPVAEFGKAFEGALDAEESRGVADAGKDLQTQLAHKKGKLGLELGLGVLFAF